MKKIFKLLTCSFLAISATTAIVTPIEINAASSRSNNNPTISTSNFSHSVKVQNNGNSILSNVSEIKVDNIISNFYTNNQSKNISMFMKQTTNSNQNQLIVNKAKNIVKQLYSNEISLSSLITKIKNWFNNLTPQQKAYVKNKILQESKKHLNIQQPLMFCYPTVLLSQTQSYKNKLNTIHQDSQQILNKLTELKALAETLTAMAIAATAIEVVEGAIFVVGWVEAAFTTAAVAADWIAVGFAWQAYKTTLDPIQNVFSATSALTSATEAITFDAYNDIVDKFEGVIDKMWPSFKELLGSIIGAEAANGADIWADPANAETVATINSIAVVVDYISTTLDVMMAALGIADMAV